MKMKDKERCNYVEVRSGKRCKGKREPNPDGLFRIMWRVLHNKELLPTKPFGFFDELRMEGRFLCHLQE